MKICRTPIGFHDAYVAAISQKAPLATSAADVDLFARGVAGTFAGIRKQERKLQRRRPDLERHHRNEVEKLETAIAKARKSYNAAVESSLA